MREIDFRSDTKTQPTAEMRRAMAEAELGDDVSGEDPTVNRLEAMAAEMFDKEAAVLVASGTMGNLIGVLASVRFNFRGVGASQGEFTNGDEERDDLRAALKTLGAWPGMDRKRLALVGYSFGASVILADLAHYKTARIVWAP